MARWLLLFVVACGGSQQQKPPAGEPAYCGGCRYPTEADKHQWDNVTVEGDLRPATDAGVAPAVARTDAAPDEGLPATGSGGLLGHRDAATGAKPRTAAVPRIVIGTAKLSRDAIVKGGVDRIVKTHANQLQYCYEKEMVATNDMTLAGKVMLAFEIDAVGKVATPTALGVTPNIAKCMSDRIATFEFPAPKAGANVHVAVTIECHPTGGE